MAEELLESYRRRTRQCRARLREEAYAGAGSRRLDPETGESWDRLNALGHIAEMLPLWTGQVRRAVREGAVIGRDEALVEERQRAIDRAAEQGEQALRAEVERGVDGLLALLDELQAADLERTAILISASEDAEVTIGDVIRSRLVGHLEEHLDQLAGF
jgi:DinB superfamily